MIQVSVIIPTYQRPKFLRLALESVLVQTFPHFEVIVVDDASRDRTPEIVKEFNDNRVRYLAHEINKGGSAARNTGISHARGKYIAFLDDDDEWLPEKLRLQIDVLEKSRPEVGGVYTGCTKINRDNGKVVSHKTPTQRGHMFSRLLIKNCISSTSSILLKKECFERVGLFDESLPSFQDYDLCLRISREFQFEAIPEQLFIYHIHEKKIWTNLEALSIGLCRMLEKYGKDLSILRKNFGYYGHLEIGALYCLSGNARKGLESYFNAIMRFPFGIKAYGLFCLCLLGTTVVKKVFHVKQRIFFAFGMPAHEAGNDSRPIL